jgi:hypothetical protein
MSRIGLIGKTFVDIYICTACFVDMIKLLVCEVLFAKHIHESQANIRFPPLYIRPFPHPPQPNYKQNHTFSIIKDKNITFYSYIPLRHFRENDTTRKSIYEDNYSPSPLLLLYFVRKEYIKARFSNK